MECWGITLMATAVTALFITVLRPHARRLGLVDHPCGHKTHRRPTPVIGGLAIFAGLVVALGVGAMWGTDYHAYLPLLIASGLLVAVGLLDDLRSLSVRVRFSIQICAAVMMSVIAGVTLTDLGYLLSPSPLTLGALALPLTVFAAVGGMNAMNMVDGVDGLAGVVALMTLAALALVAGTSAHSAEMVVLLAACGSVLAFLYFNLRFGRLRRARTFMGDAGSLLLGFIIAWFLIALAQGPQRAMDPAIALWLFGLPLLDTLAVMMRRALRGRSPFGSDRQHFHHLLLSRGVSVPAVVRRGAVVHGAMVLGGLLGVYAQVPGYLMFYLFVGIFGVYLGATYRAAQRHEALAFNEQCVAVPPER